MHFPKSKFWLLEMIVFVWSTICRGQFATVDLYSSRRTVKPLNGSLRYQDSCSLAQLPLQSLNNRRSDTACCAVLCVRVCVSVHFQSKQQLLYSAVVRLLLSYWNLAIILPSFIPPTSFTLSSPNTPSLFLPDPPHLPYSLFSCCWVRVAQTHCSPKALNVLDSRTRKQNCIFRPLWNWKVKSWFKCKLQLKQSDFCGINYDITFSGKMVKTYHIF